MKKDIDFNLYFERVIECINSIHKSDMYDVNEKENLNNVKKKIEYWYNFYLKSNTLKEINPSDIEYIDLEITDFFDKYIKTESINENYSERLLYDFGLLMKEWKNEMLGGKNNV